MLKNSFNKNSKQGAYIMLWFVVFVWAISPTINKLIYEISSPTVVNTLASFIAFIALLIYCRKDLKFLNKKYFLGLVILPYIGWSLGTLLGALAGNSLPLEITNALGIALYAMFIAIIIPPSISVKGVLPAVIIATGLSCALHYISIFNVVSQGFKFIICAVVSSLITAYFFPIEQGDSDKEVE